MSDVVAGARKAVTKFDRNYIHLGIDPETGKTSKELRLPKICVGYNQADIKVQNLVENSGLVFKPASLWMEGGTYFVANPVVGALLCSNFYGLGLACMIKGGLKVSDNEASLKSVGNFIHKLANLTHDLVKGPQTYLAKVQEKTWVFAPERRSKYLSQDLAVRTMADKGEKDEEIVKERAAAAVKIASQERNANFEVKKEYIDHPENDPLVKLANKSPYPWSLIDRAEEPIKRKLLRGDIDVHTYRTYQHIKAHNEEIKALYYPERDYKKTRNTITNIYQPIVDEALGLKASEELILMRALLESLDKPATEKMTHAQEMEAIKSMKGSELLPKDIDNLANIIKNHKEHPRTTIIRAMANLAKAHNDQAPFVVSQLSLLKTHENPHIRSAVADALGEIGGNMYEKQSGPALKQLDLMEKALANDSNLGVANSIRDAKEKIKLSAPKPPRIPAKLRKKPPASVVAELQKRQQALANPPQQFYYEPQQKTPRDF